MPFAIGGVVSEVAGTIVVGVCCFLVVPFCFCLSVVAVFGVWLFLVSGSAGWLLLCFGYNP